MKAQRGFTTIELVFAFALFLVVGFTLVTLFSRLGRFQNAAATTQQGALAVSNEETALRNDADNAFAVFVPTNDVFNKPNLINGANHEVDFYARAEDGRDVFWAYYYDPAAKTLQRYDYDKDAKGSVLDRGVRDRASGTVVAGQQYEPLPQITKFDATTLEANQVVDTARNPYAGLIASAVGGKPVGLPVSFNNDTLKSPDLYGGNTVVKVDLANEHAERNLDLSAGVMPSGFTIHGHPTFRTFLYRIDSTHRFCFGLCQKTLRWINARVDISYDNFKTPPQIWCNYNVYGGAGHDDGITPDNSDPGIRDEYKTPGGRNPAQYDPHAYNETTTGILDRCQQFPKTATPPPVNHSNIALFTPPPVVLDSPPPCFLQGTCWPPEAPPDWNPSPAPAAPPPKWFCDTHAASPLCGAKPPASGAPQPTPGLTPWPVETCDPTWINCYTPPAS